jgi:hypothetical protein
MDFILEEEGPALTEASHAVIRDERHTQFEPVD